jgi:peptidoglycan-associated lipoprotein
VRRQRCPIFAPDPPANRITNGGMNGENASMTMIRICTGVAVAAVATSACATKGYVNRQVAAMADTSRIAWTASDSSIRQEMTSQATQLTSLRTDVDSVKSNVASLRQDLNMLRDSVGAKVTALEKGMEFIFPVTFAFDDATVRDQDRAALDRFAQVVDKHYGGAVVTVEGFADPAGTAAYNRQLSLKRAEAVISYLQEKGLSNVTLKPVGLGESRQVVEGASRDMPGAESNRRVVFVVESTTGGTPSDSTRTSGTR